MEHWETEIKKVDKKQENLEPQSHETNKNYNFKTINP
jgi:hypothetical protein